jgi:hypothetical protein
MALYKEMTDETISLGTNVYENAFKETPMLLTTYDALYARIQDIMRSSRVCGNKNTKLSKPNITALANIIRYATNTFPAMKALECMFDDQTFKSQISRQVVSLIDTKNQWLKRGKKLGKGANGFTIISGIDEVIKFACKIPNKITKSGDIDIIIEYFMGVAVINNFRKFCPNFCYTLGIFKCDYRKDDTKLCSTTNGTSALYTFYEMIDGKTACDIDSPEVFMSVYIQLLVAFELAQRSNRFFHTDFSPPNVVVTNDKKEFQVGLDDKVFSFNSRMAVVIDYGQTCVTLGNNRISPFLENKNKAFYEKYNRPSFLLQGIDMIMFLANCCIYVLNEDVRKLAYSIMKTVYGDIDPYKVSEKTRDELEAIRNNDYFGKYAESRIASITPQQMLESILQIPEYMELVKDQLKISLDVYSSKEYSTYSYYKDIYGRDLKCDISCITMVDSYMLAFEIVHDAEFSGLKSHEIDMIEQKMASNIDEMMAYDAQMLEPFFKIDIPDEKIARIIKLTGIILNIPYKGSTTMSDIIIDASIKDYRSLVSFMDDYEKYVQIFCRMAHLKINLPLYWELHKRFVASRQYYQYVHVGKWIRAASRWAITIDERKSGY